MRDASAAKKPPLNRLHVWWARRPLTVSRAAILASLLPAYPTDDDPDARPLPDRFLTRFPTFEVYKAWFTRLIGIFGDPVAGNKILAMARTTGKMVPNPYTYPRAFTYNPSGEQLEQLYDLLEWFWGTRDISFCDPMSGGGSIPFEALRYGLSVQANEFNPVASMILKATLDFPARFGPSLLEDIRSYGRIWSERVQARLSPFFSDLDHDVFGACYLWARTVSCPETGKPVPLGTNWWLRKSSDPVAMRLIADPKADHCRFEIVRGEAACKRASPDKATVKRGTAVSPWTNTSIDNAYIKSESQAGRMGQQLIAVALKTKGKMDFRSVTDEDSDRHDAAMKAFDRSLPRWEQEGLVPTETLPTDAESWTHGNTPAQYGATTFADLFLPRQLMANVVILQELQSLFKSIQDERGPEKSKAVLLMLSLAIGKVVNYNTQQCFWDYTRQKIGHGFSRHDFALRWCSTEFDAAKNLLPWAVDQIYDAYSDLARLANNSRPLSLDKVPVASVTRLSLTRGACQELPIKTGSLNSITVDPPY
jgi:adenine-specific DNA methylase